MRWCEVRGGGPGGEKGVLVAQVACGWRWWSAGGALPGSADGEVVVGDGGKQPRGKREVGRGEAPGGKVST